MRAAVIDPVRFIFDAGVGNACSSAVAAGKRRIDNKNTNLTDNCGGKLAVPVAVAKF